MCRLKALCLALALSPVSLSAQQDNPFAFTGGGVKSAYIVYEMITSPKNQQPGVKVTPGTLELGVTADRYVIRMTSAWELQGKKDTLISVVATSKDSVYNYHKMAGEIGGEVSRSLRPYLAREYAALDASAKARFIQNFKLITKPGSGSNDIAEQMITITGTKKGSETVAGHTCDVYQRGKITACVIPGAPMVFLSWLDEAGTKITAKKVTLNAPVPTPAAVLPKNVKWSQKGYDEDAEFAGQIWGEKKESDPSAVPPAQLAKFAVGYLASPAATKELQQMQTGEPEETGEAEGSDSSGS